MSEARQVLLLAAVATATATAEPRSRIELLARDRAVAVLVPALEHLVDVRPLTAAFSLGTGLARRHAATVHPVTETAAALARGRKAE